MRSSGLWRMGEVLKRIVLQTLIGVFLVHMTGVAHAAPFVSIHLPDNNVITSFDFILNGSVITTTETWGSSFGGELEFVNLDDGVAYTVIRNITNNSGENWLDFELELFDPDGQTTDIIYDLPGFAMPDYTPVGFSTSNDHDDLNFAVSRDSDAFAFSTGNGDTRDLINFFGPTLDNGANGSNMFFVQLEIIDDRGVGDPLNPGHNSPFVLWAGAFETTEVSEPGVLVLLGLGIAGLAFWRRACA